MGWTLERPEMGGDPWVPRSWGFEVGGRKK